MYASASANGSCRHLHLIGCRCICYVGGDILQFIAQSIELSCSILRRSWLLATCFCSSSLMNLWLQQFVCCIGWCNRYRVIILFYWCGSPHLFLSTLSDRLVVNVLLHCFGCSWPFMNFGNSLCVLWLITLAVAVMCLQTLWSIAIVSIDPVVEAYWSATL